MIVIGWLLRLLGVRNEEGISPERRAELERIQRRTRSVLTRSVRMRLTVIARAQHK